MVRPALFRLGPELLGECQTRFVWGKNQGTLEYKYWLCLCSTPPDLANLTVGLCVGFSACNLGI